MANATVQRNGFACSFPVPDEKNKRNQTKQDEGISHIINIILTILFFLSGVCIMTISLSHPIFAFDGIKNKENQMETKETTITETEIKDWENAIIKKYNGSKIYFKSTGIAHIKTRKLISGKPVNINIVEINPKLNPELVIKPDTAGNQLNSKAQIKNIAQKNNAIVAINGGYFKPQTGVPLGSLVIDGETLTGPIYNRVGIGISQNSEGTSFSMAKVVPIIKLKNNLKEITLDNINQPRMLSTYAIIYTPTWGKNSPLAPKYGINAQIKDGKIVAMSTNSMEIPENGYVLGAPYSKINQIYGLKNLTLDIKYPEEFKNVNHIIGAGPYLVKEGNIFIDTNAQKLNAITGRNPRSAIGYTKNNTLIIITADGRENQSVGLTLNQLAYIMKSLGCYNAMNFDGGSSTVMYVGGKIVNTPNASVGGIKISNALVISEKKIN